MSGPPLPKPYPNMGGIRGGSDALDLACGLLAARLDSARESLRQCSERDRWTQGRTQSRTRKAGRDIRGQGRSNAQVEGFSRGQTQSIQSSTGRSNRGIPTNATEIGGTMPTDIVLPAQALREMVDLADQIQENAMAIKAFATAMEREQTGGDSQGTGTGDREPDDSSTSPESNDQDGAE